MKVFIAGGGTGGHFYPAYSVASYLKKKGFKIFYIGTKSGIEAKKEFPADEKVLLDMKAVRVRGVLSKAKGIYSLLSKTLTVYRLLKKEKPDFSIVFGGYTAVPLGLASFFAGVPLFVHEQNSIPSYSNKLLSFFAKKIFITFEFSKRYFPENKTVLTGIPIRSSLKERLKISKEEARKALNLPSDKKVVLVFGGSQGARKINEYVPTLAKKFPDYTFIHIEGKHKADGKETPSNVIKYQYFDDIGLLYRASDYVVCRAGSSTVNEILAFGKKAVFIPFPFAASNHQYFNVKWLYDKGLCEICLENEIEGLPEKIVSLDGIDEEKLKELSILDAEERMFEEIKRCLNLKL